MSHNPFTPPRSAIDDMLVARDRKPLAVWLVQGVALVLVVLSANALRVDMFRPRLPQAASIDSHVMAMMVFRACMLVLFATGLVLTQLRGPSGRWAGLVCVVALIALDGCAIWLAAHSEAGWSDADYVALCIVVVLLPLLLAWARAVAFTARARAWFAGTRS